VKTEYVNLYDVKSNATTKVKLQHISGVKMEPEEVTVEASADLITEKTLDVPITIVGAPEGKKVLTFPKHVSVTFVTPSSLASSIKASDFIIEVRYDEIRDDSLKKMLPLHLVQVPPFVKNAKMGIRQVDYLIEKE
jgi:hypothetical protein